MWGDSNWTGSRGDTFGRPSTGDSAAQEQENIEFEQAYIQYMSKVGLWWIGYAPHDFWGTTFGDSTRSQALIQWILPMKWGMIGAKYFKSWEGSRTLDSSSYQYDNGHDQDDDAYVAIGMYKTQDIETGLKVAYRRLADNKSGLDTASPSDGGLLPYSKVDGWLLTPYFIGQFGPVKVQAELEYWNGETEFTESWGPYSEGDELDMEFLAVYLDAKVDFGPAYVGGMFIYASGNENDTDDELEGSNFSTGFEGAWGGVDMKQTLILWNEDVTNWLGNPFADFGMQGNGVKNAFLYQIYGGYAWGDWAFKGALTYALADEEDTSVNGTAWTGKDDDYGWELDVTATYKITENLSYMVGAGYLWAGDYFTRDSDNLEIIDEVYVITNKLTLTF
jgi:hypothetical protein